jgi:hypothetical protein
MGGNGAGGVVVVYMYADAVLSGGGSGGGGGSTSWGTNDCYIISNSNTRSPGPGKNGFYMRGMYTYNNGENDSYLPIFCRIEF